MNTSRVIALSVAGLLLALSPSATAKDKDKVRVVLESRVEASKSKLRNDAATDWLTEAELKKLNTEKRAKNQQLIYFEWHLGKEKWRGIYTDKLMLRGYSWWCFYGKNEMEAKVNEEMAEGKKPAFIARTGSVYAMLFVDPEQLAEARKVLDELGIGEPKLR